MFYHAVNYDQEVNEWDTGKVTDMAQVFYRASSFKQDVNGGYGGY